MLRFSRHSRLKCRKSSFWEQNIVFGHFWGLRTEDWGLRIDDWRLRIEDWGQPFHAEESGTWSELFIAGGSPHRESINQSQIINHRESITKNQSQRINQYVNQSIINHKIGVEIINQSCAGEFWYIVWGHDNAVIFNNRGGWLIHFAKKLKVIFGKLGNLDVVVLFLAAVLDKKKPVNSKWSKWTEQKQLQQKRIQVNFQIC